jgi:RNA-binding protein
MSDLSGKQRRWLRGQAHALKPVVQLGDKGLTDAVVAEVDRSLDAHELIKVRLVGERDEREAAAADLADRVEAEAVGLTGKIAILFRPHPEPDKRRVRPPR